MKNNVRTLLKDLKDDGVIEPFGCGIRVRVYDGDMMCLKISDHLWWREGFFRYTEDDTLRENVIVAYTGLQQWHKENILSSTVNLKVLGR